MRTDSTAMLRLDRQVTLARPILLVLALVDLLQQRNWSNYRGALLFITAYLVFAILLVLGEQLGPIASFRVPLGLDIAALAVFLVMTPSVTAFWCLYLFVVFAAATHWEMRRAVDLGAAFCLALVVRVAIRDAATWHNVVRWVALGAGTFGAGAGMAFLGALERRNEDKVRFLERLSGLLKVQLGLTEAIRRILDELGSAFQCETACIVIRDEDVERLFVWKVHPGAKGPIVPESQPLARADAFLADNLETTLCFNLLDGSGESFGWDRRSGRSVVRPTLPPASLVQELGARSVAAATLESEGRPTGRVLLINRSGKFSVRDVRWIEQIVRHLGPALENIFLLRHMRARAVEAERSRVSRDLHDGILQTLLSLDIQLDVLRRKLPGAPEQVEADLGALQTTMRHEGAELRRMVTDLRPIRVESADLPELMYGFAERFRNESGLAVDLFLNGRDLRAPDRICRELFQIYRESLHNIKKHAHASHVVVKLAQDETKVSLVVDDNGQGFSFAGRYTSEELDDLRLGPISIKERTRTIGGVLTIESSPGHGARVTVEIPLS